MNTMIKKLLTNIQYKGNQSPMMIETDYKAFLIDHVTKYSVSGYVCDMTKDTMSGFKQVSIQTTKGGKRYIIADRTSFDVNEIKACPIIREIVRKRLAQCERSKSWCITRKVSGEDVGYSIENEEFYIANLTAYLEQNPEIVPETKTAEFIKTTTRR